MLLKSRLLWKTLLYVGLLYGIFVSGIPAARADITIDNPLGPRTTSITDLITSIIGQLTPVAVVIAVFAIIVVGFQFVLAAVQGEPGKIKDARKNLMWVLIGVGIIVSARLLAEAAKVFFSNL